jgi:hypothetical protein
MDSIRTYRRKTGRFSPDLIVIATEGTKTEKKYFEELSKEYCNHRSDKVQVVVLERSKTTSNPKHVLEQLITHKKLLKLKKTDKLYMVIDRDKWRVRELRYVARECMNKKFNFILSNPCFEIWFILHFESIDKLSESERQKIQANENGFLCKRIRAHVREYNKSNPNVKLFFSNTQTAIKNSEKIKLFPKQRWHDSLGTTVHQIVKRIIGITNI